MAATKKTLHSVFWEWLDDQTYQLAQANTDEEIADIFFHIMNELVLTGMPLDEAFSMVVHGLFHAGMNIRLGTALVDMILADNISQHLQLIKLYNTPDHNTENKEEDGRENHKEKVVEPITPYSSDDEEEPDIIELLDRFGDAFDAAIDGQPVYDSFDEATNNWYANEDWIIIEDCEAKEEKDLKELEDKYIIGGSLTKEERYTSLNREDQEDNVFWNAYHSYAPKEIFSYQGEKNPGYTGYTKHHPKPKRVFSQKTKRHLLNRHIKKQRQLGRRNPVILPNFDEWMEENKIKQMNINDEEDIIIFNEEEEMLSYGSSDEDNYLNNEEEEPACTIC